VGKESIERNPAMGKDYFQKKESLSSIIDALERDLPRFLPQNIIALYQEEGFGDFIATLKVVTADLLNQGMREYFKDHERRENNY
jgi:hypothetical protein